MLDEELKADKAAIGYEEESDSKIADDMLGELESLMGAAKAGEKVKSR